MGASGPRVTRAEIGLLGALAAWALFPLVLLLADAASAHARFTGADGLIGADGVLGADQLQYLAWIRDASAHGLASDLFSLSPSGHVYLQPLFEISAALVRLGLSLPLSYLLWKPVAIVALFAGVLAWARRTCGDRVARRAAVVTLALFLYTPLTALYSWTGMASGAFRFQLFLLGDELLAAGKLWGYVPSALGIALVPLTLLALERAVGRERAIDPRGGGARTASSSGAAGAYEAGSPAFAGLAALAALLASWLHPWQGITLILIAAGLGAVRRPRDPRVIAALAAVVTAAALPLGYYALLSHSDPAWRLASGYEVIPRLPVLVLLAGFGPLALIAGLGVRRPRGVLIEQALLLWIGATVVNYFVNDAFAPHALQGLSLPLAVLIVRGWSRLRLPAIVGVAAIGLVTIPGLAFDARKFVRTADSTLVQYALPSPDARALDWIAAHAPAGGVLAPTPLASVIPSQTGRAVWVGDGYWSPDYPSRAHRADLLFLGRMRRAQARAFVASTGARLLVSDCRDRRDLARALGALVAAVHRFGCARVYVLAAAGPAAQRGQRGSAGSTDGRSASR